MKDITVAATDWGLHAVACSGLRDAPPSAWLGTLRNALPGSGMSGSGTGRSLFLDLREVGFSPLPPSHLGALASVVAKAGISAVLVSDLRLGHALCDAVRRSCTTGETASGLRVLSADGRDRVAIAAAYQWLLNGREPADALRVSDGRPSVLPFPTTTAQKRPNSPGSAALRHAS